MARIRPQTGFETTLTSSISASQTTIPVTTCPTETTGFFVIEPGTANKEIIKYTGSSNPGGAGNLTGVTRGLSLTGSSVAAGTGTAHAAGKPCNMTNTHYYMEQLAGLDDDNTFTASSQHFGPGTAGDITLYANNADTNKPFWRYDDTLNKWIFSNDGTNTFDPSAGGSGLTAGGGIAINGGAISVVTPALLSAMNASDGTVTVDSGSFSSGPITSNALTRDAYFDTLTINSGVSLDTAGYKLFCKTALVVNGTLKRNGNNGGTGGNGTAGAGQAGGSAGSAGSALSAGTLGGTVAGVAGGAGGASPASGGAGLVGNVGVVGVAGNAQANSATAVNGVAGASGGKGSTNQLNAGGAGGAGGALGTATASTTRPYMGINCFFAVDNLIGTNGAITTILWKSSAGSGGGGGGGSAATGGGGGESNSSGSGGGGGGSGCPGGLMLVMAKSITVGSAGAIQALGGNGGNGGNGATNGSVVGGGGGAGGSGGSGGMIMLFYQSLSNSGSISAAGGSGGTGGTKAGSGDAANGSDGTAGASGVVVSITV